MRKVKEIDLVMGGQRSGKSRFAESLLLGSYQRLSSKQVEEVAPILYLATMYLDSEDREQQERVERHRRRREESSEQLLWETIEEPLAPGAALQLSQGGGHAEDRLVLLECILYWVNNLLWKCEAMRDPVALVRRESREAIFVEVLERIDAEIELLLSLPLEQLVVVSGEVGLGGIGETPLERFYADLIGEANQRFAHQADRVTLVVAGLPLQVK